MDMLEPKGQLRFPDIRLQIKSLEMKWSDLRKGTFYAESNHLRFDCRMDLDENNLLLLFIKSVYNNF
ncbi:hypothetical protein [Peribacillus frigoritolerans]|uniref:hypothetical protein n=1 Tax=Peribacillus frigoritolerans TaxID=450367 RepID=UPI002B2444B4|nr:hypothetical protein [Peribacillus frigoritolerans]